MLWKLTTGYTVTVMACAFSLLTGYGFDRILLAASESLEGIELWDIA